MRLLVQFTIGLVFGLGLVVAGMSDPAKVLNFLDVASIGTGVWDASLAFVMAAAVAVTFAGYRWLRQRQAPLMADRFHFPADLGVTRGIMVGPLVFGAGWGLVGLCPGPAITALAFGGSSAWLFGAAMLAGMALARWLGSTRRVVRAPSGAMPDPR